MRTSRLLVVFGVLALIAAACGDDDSSNATSQDDAPPATEERAVTVGLDDSELGPILVDGEGRTLYLFTKDEPGTSNCTDDCATTWPPLEAPDELVGGDGVDESLLGTIERDDGTSQVTYASMPLYYYAADSEPGDTNGQGVGDVWFVVGADGEAIESAASSSAPGY